MSEHPRIQQSVGFVVGYIKRLFIYYLVLCTNFMPACVAELRFKVMEKDRIWSIIANNFRLNCCLNVGLNLHFLKIMDMNTE